ncbi:MAG: tyrosine-type recombinase/integrase [archaeon]
MDVLDAMKKEMLRRRLSPRTIETYLFYVRKFLAFCKKEPKHFSRADCLAFLDRYAEKTGNTMNVTLNSVRFLMEEILRKRMKLGICYAKTPKKMPRFLSREEVDRLLNAINNPKYKLLVSLMYGAGLRVSEVLNLKKEDLHLKQGIGWVRQGKGNKDRPFIIPSCLLIDLSQCSKGLLFKGKNGKLSIRSVQEIVKHAARSSCLKSVHPHTLRHSFATHLVQNGESIGTVQGLLGHNDPRTTFMYVHAAGRLLATRSPLDKPQAESAM